MFQRDVFIQEITKRLDKDKSIFFLSADFGAPALDILREKFPKNFVHLRKQRFPIEIDENINKNKTYL